MVGCCPTDRIVLTVLSNHGPVRIQTDPLCSTGWQHRYESFLRQHHRELRILEHAGQTLWWRGWVKRHIGRPRLENTQQSHHHLKGALDAESHQHLWTHTAG